MDWISITIVILSLGLSLISWIAKLRWSKEYKETKEERIKFLEDQVEHYKELSSTQLHDYFKSTIEEYENVHEELRKKLNEIENEKKSDHPEEEFEILKQRLKQKEIALAEIHHRIKNNLAVISAMINLKTLDLENDLVANEMKDVNNKIFAIAQIHELLYQNFEGIKFDDYINQLRDLYNLRIRLDNKLNQLFDINSFIPIALTLNEILTQLDLNNTGEIDIKAKKIRDIIIININPMGNREVKSLLTSSSLKLIDSFKTRLEGTIRYNGSFEISFPIDKEE